MERSSNDMRVGYADMAILDFPVTFNGNTYSTNVIKTGLGDFLMTRNHVLMS